MALLDAGIKDLDCEHDLGNALARAIFIPSGPPQFFVV